MSNHNSRIDTLAADQAMIDGITKNQSKLPKALTVGSQSTSPTAMIAVYQGRVTAAKAVTTAEAASAAAVKANNTERAQTAALTLAWKQLIIAMFKNSPDVLGDFGLASPKVAEKSAAVKAEAAVKGNATRKALGTKGKVQKKEALAQESATTGEPAAPAAPAAQATPSVKPAS
jgi:hypothetical protein